MKSSIDDRSTVVRERAASTADHLWLTELVPQLQHRKEVETSDELKATLNFHIAMLTDEYLLEPGPSDERRLHLRIRVAWGWRTILVEPEEVQRGRVPEIVRYEQKNRFGSRR